jgi:hypothetical protein
VPCKGAFLDLQFATAGRRHLSIDAPSPASWRIVVHGEPGTAGAAGSLPTLERPAGHETLVDRAATLLYPGSPPYGDAGFVFEEFGTVAARNSYTVQAVCRAGSAIRVVLGHDDAGVLLPDTLTWVPCDGSTHRVDLRIPAPSGGGIYVAGDPATMWSILVSDDTPPVALATDVPGWQMSTGFGPDLSFDGAGASVPGDGVQLDGFGSGPGGGNVQVIIECAGSGSIDVGVDLDPATGQHIEHFEAACEPGGARTSQIFVSPSELVQVRYLPPVGAWTALTILVPTPPPAP